LGRYPLEARHHGFISDVNCWWAMNRSARSHQMKLRRLLTLSLLAAGTAAFLQAQQPASESTRNTQPTFKEHRIGETAQQFFSIARVAEKNAMLSTDYCRSYLNDPKVKKTIEKARHSGSTRGAGCRG
jgi:hypothetical protein